MVYKVRLAEEHTNTWHDLCLCKLLKYECSHDISLGSARNLPPTLTDVLILMWKTKVEKINLNIYILVL